MQRKNIIKTRVFYLFEHFFIYFFVEFRRKSLRGKPRGYFLRLLGIFRKIRDYPPLRLEFLRVAVGIGVLLVAVPERPYIVPFLLFACVYPSFYNAVHLLHQHFLLDLVLVRNFADVDLTFYRRTDIRKDVHAFFQVLDFPLIGGNIQPRPALVKLKLNRSPRLVKELFETQRAEFFYVFVGVFCPLHADNFRPHANLRKQVYRLVSGVLPRAVRVVGNNDFLRILGHKPSLLLRQSRSEGRNNVLKARLIYGDNVHVALRKNKPFFLRFFGKIH